MRWVRSSQLIATDRPKNVIQWLLGKSFNASYFDHRQLSTRGEKREELHGRSLELKALKEELKLYVSNPRLDVQIWPLKSYLPALHLAYQTRTCRQLTRSVPLDHPFTKLRHEDEFATNQFINSWTDFSSP